MLNSPKKTIAKSIITISQLIPAFKARGSYSSLGKAPSELPKMGSVNEFPEAAFEYSDSNNFVSNFPDQDIGKLIQDKTVLDLGSGYGGRTVWYAEKARWAWGIEIFPSMVAKSARFAEFARTQNVSFVVGQE